MGPRILLLSERRRASLLSAMARCAPPPLPAPVGCIARATAARVGDSGVRTRFLGLILRASGQMRSPPRHPSPVSCWAPSRRVLASRELVMFSWPSHARLFCFSLLFCALTVSASVLHRSRRTRPCAPRRRLPSVLSKTDPSRSGSGCAQATAFGQFRISVPLATLRNAPCQRPDIDVSPVLQYCL